MDAVRASMARAGQVAPDADTSKPSGEYVVKDAFHYDRKLGKLSFNQNGSGAGQVLKQALGEEFPGIDLNAVLNKAAGARKFKPNLSQDEMIGLVRAHCQYAVDDLTKSQGRAGGSSKPATANPSANANAIMARFQNSQSRSKS